MWKPKYPWSVNTKLFLKLLWKQLSNPLNYISSSQCNPARYCPLQEHIWTDHIHQVPKHSCKRAQATHFISLRTLRQKGIIKNNSLKSALTLKFNSTSFKKTYTHATAIVVHHDTIIWYTHDLRVCDIREIVAKEKWWTPCSAGDRLSGSDLAKTRHWGSSPATVKLGSKLTNYGCQGVNTLLVRAKF